MYREHSGPMTPQDWVGVAIRVLGIWSFFLAFGNLLYFIDARAGLSSAAVFSTEEYDPDGYLVYVLGYGALGLLLLRGATAITRFAFPAPRHSEDENPENTNPRHSTSDNA